MSASLLAAAGFFADHAHPLVLLVGLAFFPRLTLLFVGGPFGVLHWLGWLVAPHLLVAILATGQYWSTDPFLCVVAWFFAFAGTGSEGKLAHVSSRRRWARRDA
ncbi:MAG: hypothetical protein K1X89_22405 [Myxococcaceae bacterium]|nr:hypothetical protein [Myxococcaceae bacterium]